MNCILNLAGIFSLYKEHLDDALQLYDEAILLYELDPQGFARSSVDIKAWIFLGIGNVNSKQQKYDESLIVYAQALALTIEHNDDNLEYQIIGSQAYALFQLSKNDEALKKFEEAISKERSFRKLKQKPYDNMDYDLYRNCGACYAHQATKFAKREIKQHNNINVSYIENTKQSLSYYNQACKMYLRALKITSQIYGNNCLAFLKAKFEYGEIKALKGDIDDAWKIFNNIKKSFEKLEEKIQKREKAFRSNIENMLSLLQVNIKQ